MLWREQKIRRKLVDFLIDHQKFAAPLLRLLRFRPVRLASQSSGGVEGTGFLAEGDYSSLKPPDLIKTPSKLNVIPAPGLKFRVVSDCMVSAYSSGILKVDSLLLPDFHFRDFDRLLVENAGLFRVTRAGNVATKVKKGNFQAYAEDKAIFVGGPGSSNWYHFNVECLPRAFLSQKLPIGLRDLPLIVPEEAKAIPQFADALDAFSNGRRIIYLGRKQRLTVKQLIVIDEVSYGPFNLRQGHWPALTDYFQHDLVMKDYVATYRSRMLGSDYQRRGGKRRLFLARKGARRRYNQDELFEISRRFGFERIEPECLSLKEQAEVFSESSALIGPSGAAWVGLIFCVAPIRGLSWLPETYVNFCNYSTLAHTLGHQLKFINSRYSSKLKHSGDAYEKRYEVCPKEFEESLKLTFSN